MKDRLSKISRKATFAFCLLAACGLNYSCADEYKLDDEAPTFLGSSIYDYLKDKKNGNYTNFVKMIDELGLQEVLSTTGSKTLFVADDEAFEKFYKSNENTDEDYAWHNATSYENLTLAQKKILVHTAMLNNAYLLEMLPRATGNPPTKGASMRKETSIELTDSITFFKPADIPASDDTTATDYWKNYREKGGMYMVSDNSVPMMVYFISEQMSKAGITNEDFEILTGKERTSSDAHIYFNKVVKQDITCQNGYINVLDSVLIPPGNMAEVIRTNGKTDIFSHILDRFSAPFYNSQITENYKVLHKDFTDSIFVKKYISEWTNNVTVSAGFDKDYTSSDNRLAVGPDNAAPSSVTGGLKFDPGWNQYKSNSVGATSAGDMAAMFVPTDDVLKAYFLPGGEGSDLIKTYGDRENTEENLLHNIDMIPLNTINSFMNNLMQISFINSIPSKFGQILDQANDNLFQDPEDAIRNIEEVKIANNGVVYLMKKVYPPVDYASVASPAFISKDNQIMKFAIYNGSGLDSKTNLMNLHFYAYLRAMGSKFTLLLPSDKALQYYVDPLSVNTDGKNRVLAFKYTPTDNENSIPVTCKAMKYDAATGQIADERPGETVTDDEIKNRLKDILETHTIVHTETETNGVLSGNEYYISKNGSPIHVKNTGGSEANLKFQGAMQVEQELNGYQEDPTYPNPGIIESAVTQPYKKVNGWTYCLEAPIAVATRSVYNVLSNKGETEGNPYQKFFELCNGMNTELLVNCGLIDASLDDDDQATQTKKYSVFVLDGMDYNVSFFNNYRYTVYVPTNAAIQKAIDENDLPTWESIKQFVDENMSKPDWATKYQPIAKAQAKCLINFVRGHFQDNSIFADKLPFAATSYETATLDDEGKKFVSVTVTSEGNGDLRVYKKRNEEGDLSEDNLIYDCKITGTVNKMTRDYNTNVDYTADNVSLSGSQINSSSFAVIHQIDGVMHFSDLKDSNGSYYIKYWKDLETAKQTAAKLKIKNK